MYSNNQLDELLQKSLNFLSDKVDPPLCDIPQDLFSFWIIAKNDTELHIQKIWSVFMYAFLKYQKEIENVTEFQITPEALQEKFEEWQIRLAFVEVSRIQNLDLSLIRTFGFDGEDIEVRPL